MVFKYLIIIVGILLPLRVLAQEVPLDPDTEEQPGIFFADPAPDDLYAIVVTGRRTHVDYLNRPLTVIGLEEIRSIQGADIARILQRVPGLTLSRNGGMGSVTSVRLRGSEADQLLVMLDGVPLNDVSSPGGGYDFATILPAGIGQVEVLRSANSTVWGSRAMGGVISMTSREADGFELSAEYGEPQGVLAQAAGGYFSAPVEFHADGGFLDSRGISSAASGQERDGLRHWQGGGSLRVSPHSEIETRLTYRHSDGRADIDGFPEPDFILADTEEWQRSRMDVGRAELIYWTDSLALRSAYSLSQTRRATFDPAAGPDATFASNGRAERLELRGEWDVQRRTSLQFGAEQERSRLSTLGGVPQDTGIFGAYVQVGHRTFDYRINAGLRRDDHRDFGGQWSMGADAAVSLSDDWEAKASYGEGFKAPTLFQLHSDYGNGMLLPERSRSWDLSLQKGVRNFRSSVSFSMFRRDSVDLIGFVSCFADNTGICAERPYGTYDNIGRARAQGIELEAMVELTYRLKAQAALAYIDARDRTPGSLNEGKRLARRPSRAGTFTLDWEALGDEVLHLGADLRLSSGSFDDPVNTSRLGAYALLDLRASAFLSDEYEVFARIENIWNERYQTAAGYNSPGRAAFIGARARY